jgi:tetratricopeptide (TPR) repeat protein
MKMKIIVVAFGLFAMTQLVKAQSQCAINLSLMNESARNGQFAEAFGPWKSVFEECPDESLAIYTQGVRILRWKLADAAEKGDMVAYQEFFELLMKMYDKRIEFFGTNAATPTARILGMKALDYANFVQGDELKKQAYEWLKQSVEGMGDAADLEILRQYILLSGEIYKADPAHAETYIDDYLKAAGILERQAANPENANAEAAAQIKQQLDIAFIQSGVANCEILDGIYAAEVEANLDNLDVLNRIITFYNRVGCNEQEVYFRAALAAHRIQPTVESAFGSARMSLRRNEWQNAINFLNEATELSTDNNEKANYQLTVAALYFQRLNNFARARTHAERALSFNPSLGGAHMLIGSLYASAKNLYGDPVLDKTVYWVAVDRFNRARQVDSSVTDEANRFIRMYSPHFPTREEIFFHPELNQIGEGGNFTVGGWINERTTVRAATQ